MYTVILVNEKLKNKFADNVNWGKCGFKLLNKCETFSESVKLIETFDTDVLITDFDDELESIINAIRKKKPLLEIVFFTDKKDFMSAKTAVSLSALEYIVKPCSISNFEQALLKVKEKLDRKCVRAEVFRDYFMTSLSVQKLPDNMKFAIDNFKLNLTGEDFIIINVQNINPQQFKISVFFDTIRNVFGKYLNGECFLFNDIVTIVASDMAGKIKKNLNLMLIAIIQNLEKHSEAKFVIGISNGFSTLDKIPKAYKEALDALFYLSEEKNEVTLFKDIKWEELEADFFENVKNNLEKKIKFESVKEVKIYIETVFNELIRNKVSIANFYALLLTMISVCDSLENGSNLKFSFLESMMDNKQLKLMRNKVIERGCALCENFIAKRQSGIERIVEQAITLIEENYKNPELSLKYLSETLHISINYLCAIMKKIKGISFVNLLTNVRMEKSKDLLVQTNSRIQEVAYEVGFTDQHYFSYCFRKHFNTTPKEMRECAQRKKA